MLHAEARVCDGRFEFDCPRCQAFMTVKGSWSSGWVTVVCTGCGETLDVVETDPPPTLDEPFVVLPLPPKPSSRAGPAPALSVRAITVFLWTGVLVLATWLDNGRHPRFLQVTIALGVVSGVLALRHGLARARHAVAIREERFRAARLAVDEAARLGRTLREELQQLRDVPAQMRQADTRARKALERVRDAASSQAYTAFWDAVAEADDALGEALYRSRDLNWRVARYATQLEGQQHNFPLAAPLVAEWVPAMMPAFQKLIEWARRGENDPELADALARHKKRDNLLGEIMSVAGRIECRGWWYEEQYNLIRSSAAKRSAFKTHQS